MIPTLFGRWQTRIFLLATIGVLVSIPFALIAVEPGSSHAITIPGLGLSYDTVFFWVLLWVGIIGLAWDVLYDFLQKFLWDHDWPGALQFFGAIAEFVLLAILVYTVTLPGIPSGVNFFLLLFHYTTVSVIAFALSWVVMRVLFQRWRFRGGEWLGGWPQG